MEFKSNSKEGPCLNSLRTINFILKSTVELLKVLKSVMTSNLHFS